MFANFAPTEFPNPSANGKIISCQGGARPSRAQQCSQILRPRNFQTHRPMVISYLAASHGLLASAGSSKAHSPISPHHDSAMTYHYQIQKASTVLPLNADWNAPAWAGAEQLEIAHFRPESSSHRPKTFVKLLYSHDALHGIYQVHDRYVRCVRSNYFDEVWKDSCVEFFAQPKPDRGYFNFEFNCGGAFLCSY